MTVQTTSNQTPWGEFGGAGLEDIDASDLSIARLKIDPPTATLVNSSTNEVFNELTMIFLGVVKQRGYFHPLYNDQTKNLGPICKSNDFDAGFPSKPFDLGSMIAFPWQRSGFNPEVAGKIDPQLQRVRLDCNSCQLKEWPSEKGATPPCKEMHTYPVLYSHPTSGDLVPALFTVKSSAIKNSKAFLTSFANNRSRPLFTAWTRVTLTPGRQGSVMYATPNFAPNFDPNAFTPQERWAEWYGQWNMIRDSIRQPPRPFEEEDMPQQEQQSSGGTIAGEVVDDPWSNYADASPAQNGSVNTAWPPAQPQSQQAPQAPPPAPPVQQAAPGRMQPPPAAPPVQQPVAAPQPPSPPPAAPPAAPAVAAPQQPAQAAPTPAAAPVPPTPVASGPVVADDDDLPF